MMIGAPAVKGAGAKPPPLSDVIFTGVLQGAKVASIMSGDAAAFCPPIKKYTSNLNTRETNIYKKTSTFSKTAFASLRFFVTVKNKDTNENYTHIDPLADLDDWHVHFINKPIFKDVNPIEDVDWPKLTPPSKDSGSIWTLSIMIKAEHTFNIITTIAPISYVADAAVPSYDIVTLHACPPPMLPRKNMEFRTKFKTSEERRMCCIHYACTAHAKERGFVESYTEKNQLGYRCLQLAGEFTSHVREEKAGSVVIPYALKYLSFLCPVVDISNDITYDIIQPHKYAYIFQIRFLSGWIIFGCVNMFHPSSNLLKLKFNNNKQSQTYEQSICNIFTAPKIPITSYSIISISEHLKSTSSTIDSIAIRYDADINDYYYNISTYPPASFNPFYDSTAAKFFGISQVNNVTETDRDILNSLTFIDYLQFIGMYYICFELKRMKQTIKRNQDVILGNLFIANLEAAYGKKGISSSSSSTNGHVLQKLTKQQLISSVFPILFQFCLGLAEQVIQQYDSMTANLRRTYNEMIRTDFFNAVYHDNPEHHIDSQTLISFLKKTCWGTPADKWAIQASGNFIISNIYDFTLSLFHLPSLFAILMPDAYWGITELEFKDLIADNVLQFDDDINDAFKSYDLAFRAELTLVQAKQALAYAILTNDSQNAKTHWL